MRTRARLAFALIWLSALVLASSVTQAADPFAVRGSALIKSVDAYTIRIVVHNFSSSGEDPAGAVDHIFNFWSRTAVPDIDFTTELAGIEFNGEQLTIVSADHERQYVFDVEREQPLDRDRGEDPGPQLRSSVPVGFTAQSFHGFGLNHQMGSAVSALKLVLGAPHRLGCDECYEPAIDSGNNSDTTCAAGGPGSTSCSYTSGGYSCSTSCGAGYYTCCNASNNCRCVPNGQ